MLQKEVAEMVLHGFAGQAKGPAGVGAGGQGLAGPHARWPF